MEPLHGFRSSIPVTYRLIAAFIFLFASAHGQDAEEQLTEILTSPPGREVLVVGVVAHPPYARQEADGSWQGLAVNVWRTAAEEADLDYEFVEATQEELVDGVATGRFDAGLPAVADPDKLGQVDYSFPFYTATLGVAEPRQSAVIKTVTRLASMDFLKIVLYLSGLLLVIGAIIWLIERNGNEEQFHKGPLKGLGDGFWWAGVTLTTIGYGDKAPRSFFGRAVAMLWMLIGLAVSATLTAAVVSAMDLSGPGSTLSGIGDKSVGAANGSGAHDYLEAKGIDVQRMESLEAGLKAVEEGDLDLVVHSAPALRSKAREMNLNLRISSTQDDPEPIAIMLPVDSSLEDTLDAAIIRRTASPGWWDQVERWVPEPKSAQ